MRKAIAGLVLGLGAGALVLGVAQLFARQSAGSVDPLQSIEFRTYDWRLARTARPDTARPDLALVEIDDTPSGTCSRTPGDGRGRAPSTRC